MDHDDERVKKLVEEALRGYGGIYDVLVHLINFARSRAEVEKEMFADDRRSGMWENLAARLDDVSDLAVPLTEIR